MAFRPPASCISAALFLSLLHNHSPASAQAHKAPARPTAQPSGPSVLIDTTMGRLTCKLLTKQAPQTAANFIALATGKKEWTDPATGQPVKGKPFYDGTALIGVTDGIGGGDRSGEDKGVAGPSFSEEKTSLHPDRAGVLAMTVEQGKTNSSQFVILEHADLEYEGRVAVFGLCDAPSVQRITLISHALLRDGNHPAMPIAINRVIVLQPGEQAPPLTADVPSESVVPRFGPEPKATLPAPEPTGPTVVIDTTMGKLTCRLFKETTMATANFLGLADGSRAWRNPATDTLMHHKPFYSGLHFERVIPDFMIEQGDLPGDGTGDGNVGFKFANEIIPGLTFDRPGRLAYANFGPDTNASAFFITEHVQHRLDGNFTIFGQCDEASVALVEKIARVPRNSQNEPLKPITIRGIIGQR